MLCKPKGYNASVRSVPAKLTVPGRSGDPLGALRIPGIVLGKIPKQKAEAIAKLLDCEVQDIFIPFTFTNCETIAKEAK